MRQRERQGRTQRLLDVFERVQLIQHVEGRRRRLRASRGDASGQGQAVAHSAPVKLSSRLPLPPTPGGRIWVGEPLTLRLSRRKAQRLPGLAPYS